MTGVLIRRGNLGTQRDIRDGSFRTVPAKFFLLYILFPHLNINVKSIKYRLQNVYFSKPSDYPQIIKLILYKAVF